MTERVVLPILTADGRHLVHAYERHRTGAEGLVVGFPGNHYGVDGPLLYYPISMLENLGWDTLTITYGYQSKGEEFTPNMVPGLLQETQSALEMVLQVADYKRIALLGKSLGAFAVAYLAAQVEGARPARCVYLTPPLDNTIFLSSLMAAQQESYLAIGSADRYYDPERLAEIRQTKQISVRLIQDADHSLNVAHDFRATLDALATVTEDVLAFVTAE